jgi:hypothetical protein
VFDFVGAGAMKQFANVSAGHPSETQTVVMPAGVEDGDLVLFVLGAYETTGTMHATFSAGSWVALLVNAASNDLAGTSDHIALWCYAKVADNEPGSYNVTLVRDSGTNFFPAGEFVAYQGIGLPDASDRQLTVGGGGGSPELSVLASLTAQSHARPADGLIYVGWGATGAAPFQDVEFSGLPGDAAMDWDALMFSGGTDGPRVSVRLYHVGSVSDPDDFPTIDLVMSTSPDPKPMGMGFGRMWALADLLPAPTPHEASTEYRDRPLHMEIRDLPHTLSSADHRDVP